MVEIRYHRRSDGGESAGHGSTIIYPVDGFGRTARHRPLHGEIISGAPPPPSLAATLGIITFGCSYRGKVLQKPDTGAGRRRHQRLRSGQLSVAGGFVTPSPVQIDPMTGLHCVIRRLPGGISAAGRQVEWRADVDAV